MFPKSRKERDMMRARWPISSIGKMMGTIHQMGPRKCLMYLMPWYFTPMKWVKVKDTKAQESVVLMLAVGGKNPGMSPIRLQVTM